MAENLSHRLIVKCDQHEITHHNHLRSHMKMLPTPIDLFHFFFPQSTKCELKRYHRRSIDTFHDRLYLEMKKKMEKKNRTKSTSFATPHCIWVSFVSFRYAYGTIINRDFHISLSYCWRELHSEVFLLFLFALQCRLFTFP